METVKGERTDSEKRDERRERQSEGKYRGEGREKRR